MNPVSPKIFSLIQMNERLAPITVILVLALILGFILNLIGVFNWANFSGMVLIGIFGPGFYFIAWVVVNQLSGLVIAPKCPWRIVVEENSITITTKSFSTKIELLQIKEVIWVTDDSWDKLKRYEEEGLILKIGRLSQICVPGSSGGFSKALEHFRTKSIFNHKELSC